MAEHNSEGFKFSLIEPGAPTIERVSPAELSARLAASSCGCGCGCGGAGGAGGGGGAIARAATQSGQ